VVGVNAFTETEPSPLLAGAEDGGFLAVDPAAEAEQISSLRAWRAARDAKAAAAALADLARAAREGANIMAPSIAAAHAGVTTGEWGDALRKAFGDWRAPTGVGRAAAAPGDAAKLEAVRKRVGEVSRRLGRRVKMLVGKPGLDGHSNGAEQVAVRARDAGFEVVYEGIRLTPDEIVNAAVEEGVHVVGLSILSGSHRALVAAVVEGMEKAGIGDIPVVVGGIIPPEDAAALKAAGVAAVYTPKDFDLNAIMADIVEIVERGGREAA
jgi:(2R)-ethylmalonyl-CoA mutase